MQHGIRAALLAGIVLSSTASAQPAAYPSKPVRIVVGLAPGGGADTFARFLARNLTETLGQQVVVDNRPGAGGLIGGEFVSRSAADGYTLLVGGSGQLAASLAHRRMDTERDFTPIVLGMDQFFLLTVHPSLPAANVAGLIKLAKARPNDMLFASAGAGSAGHLAMELFNMTAGIKLIHVPYKGAGAALADVMAGQVPIIFSSPLGTVPVVRSGRLRALATSGPKRTAALPEVPTIAESGLAGFAAASFLGMFGPPGLPREIVQRLNGDVVRIIERPESREWLLRQGAEPAAGTPEQFAARIRADLERLGKVIRAIDLKL
jgi:tripartite-type tricarboxylate transporter receptor subunit TctC